MDFRFFKTSLIMLAFCASNNAVACTDFKVTAKDGSIVITRSMEFALDLKSNLRSSPKGREFTTSAPSGKAGLTWKARYGYIFLDGLNADYAVDGINEQGLTYEALFFPGFAKYQDIADKQSYQGLPYMRMGDWALSNFKTVDEIRKALPSILVFAQTIPEAGDMIFPLHFSFYDASGKGLIVEYIDGQLNMYDNNVGVFTNAPAFNWHTTNLNNYVSLKPYNPSPVTVNGVTYEATGQGGGMVGLPGDITPPSRFIKTAILSAVALQPANAAEAVNLAEHIINNVDIPLGLAREPQTGNYTNELTQWVFFKDISNRVVYFRTYNNMTLRSVNMAQVNFDPKSPRLKMPIATQAYVQDLTTDFLKKPA